MSRNSLAEALYSISPEDRDTWVRVGMALKSELGDGGFHLWDQWSRQSEKYIESHARAVWRSIKAEGRIGMGTLYHMARERGWEGQEAKRPVLSPEERRRLEEQKRTEREVKAKRRAQVAEVSHKIISEALWTTHPYLAMKGFPDENGLVASRDYTPEFTTEVPKSSLLVPMRDYKTNDVSMVQWIDDKGTKMYLSGGRAAMTVFRIGRGRVKWYCEGLATALSVKLALTRLYRTDEVVVCFSDGNLVKIARDGYVVADHDVSEAGEKAAKRSGQPYWLSRELGDFNDFHLKYGIRAAAESLREFLVSTK